MDKKPNYSSRQGSNKGLQSSESSVRKSLDSISSKQWPRNARRRENPNQTNSKLDPARKSGGGGSAKIRSNVDKRPKPRGFGGNTSSAALNVSAAGAGLALDGSVVASGGGTDQFFEAELNSIYSPGSKKQNLNHLLNFNYGSREYENAGTVNFFNRTGNRNVVKRHKYNKEQFLQANFQFVIKCSANVQANIASPDTLVDWNLIEQINIQTTEEPQCPICLYPPIAAKLTRCGHAYCWPCILHYLALSDKTWRKCPICYDAVHTADLKSTTIVQQANLKIGDFVTMQLMRRKQGSIFIENVGKIERDESIPHLRENNDKKKFTKFLLADSNEILSIIERERGELISGVDLDSPESIFVQQALELLLERQTNVVKTMDKNEMKIMDKIDLEVVDEVGEIAENLDNLILLDEQNSTSESDIVEEMPRILPNDGTKYYYFYQSNDGQNIYLHSLNVKMLQRMYGSLEQSPSMIQAKILEKESHSMDDDLRKRLRYLQHLPLTCQFEVVELQFESPVISAEVLETFKDDIIARHKSRMRRARDERKRERQINEINERQMGKIISRSANIDITSSQQFPSCGFDDFLTGISISSDFPLSFTSNSSDSPPVSSKQPAGTSFAKMLSASKEEFWPSLATDSSSSGVLSESSSWAKPIASTVAAVRRNAERTFESDSFAELTEDHFLQQNLGDAIVEAIHLKQTAANRENATKSTPSGGGKKSKKNKKMLLFSTGMNNYK